MIPKRLVFAREFRGLDQVELANQMGNEGKSPSSNISSYETGRSQPKYSFMEEVARVLDFPVEYFYAKNDYMAEAILAFYQNRFDPDKNPYHEAVREVERLNIKLAMRDKKLLLISDIIKNIDR